SPSPPVPHDQITNLDRTHDYASFSDLVCQRPASHSGRPLDTGSVTASPEITRDYWRQGNVFEGSGQQRLLLLLFELVDALRTADVVDAAVLDHPDRLALLDILAANSAADLLFSGGGAGWRGNRSQNQQRHEGGAESDGTTGRHWRTSST